MNEEMKYLENSVGWVPRPESEVLDGHRTPEVHSFADICESTVTMKDADV